ncbi:hypothetical protein Sjap_023436 [Stephania japonica]|uniref:BTB domain-containing protein n=1 Tax=Stephania japonica TaxID=461633 RepID=A0AAP0EBM9_9MAGN
MSTSLCDESKFSSAKSEFRRPRSLCFEAPPHDVRIVTPDGLCVRAHSSVLASASAVFEKILDRLHRSRSVADDKTIPFHGVPSDAVVAFIGFCYTSKCGDEEMEKYALHLLTLSHAFAIPHLKTRCAKQLASTMTIDNAIDVAQIARLCDASDLYIWSMIFISNNFKSVQSTDGWKFVQRHDPYLELEILQFLEQRESRDKGWRKNREAQRLFAQLSEGMACLEHICTEGCVGVGPVDVGPAKTRGSCDKFDTCRGVQLLIRHFATCKDRVEHHGECFRCKRMWQILRLHSSVCDRTDHSCRVPLCREFKLRMQMMGRKAGGDARWKVLVRKVRSVKAMSSFVLTHLEGRAKRSISTSIESQKQNEALVNVG